MLAPYTERITNEALLALCAASLQEYPAFVQRVRDASGVDSQLRLSGVFYAAFESDGLEALQEHARALQARGIDCAMLDRGSALAAEPWLGGALLGGLLKKAEGYVDNRRLGRALAAACEARGVRWEQSARDCRGMRYAPRAGRAHRSRIRRRARRGQCVRRLGCAACGRPAVLRSCRSNP